MDPVTIGATVVALLTPYVKDAGQELVKTAGEAGVAKVKELLHWLKGKFAGDQVASADLTRFEKDPATLGPVLQTTIATKAQEDPAFANEIADRVKDMGPIIKIVQNFDRATNMVGLNADSIAKGDVSVTQTGKQAEGVTGVTVKTIG
jgi:hypothetical protein